MFHDTFTTITTIYTGTYLRFDNRFLFRPYYCNIKQKHRCVALISQGRMHGESVKDKESWRIKFFELGKDLFNLWAGRVSYDCAKSCRQTLLRRTNGYASDTRMIVLSIVACYMCYVTVPALCHREDMPLFSGCGRRARDDEGCGGGVRCISLCPFNPSVTLLSSQNGVPRSCAYSVLALPATLLTNIPNSASSALLLSQPRS